MKFLYNKLLESCKSKLAPYILAVVSFTESCCFIVPPEVMLLPMGYAQRKKAFRFALITSIASVFGAAAGYYMGAFLWAEISTFVFDYIPGFEKNFDHVGNLYQQNAVSTLLIAAFTPIPYKVFTVVAGVYSAKISFFLLLITAIVGRGTRYFILSGLIYFFGAKAQEIIEKHFTKFTILVGVLVVIVAILLKMRH